MSRVYFHSQSGTAELRGWERAWASGIVEDLASGVIMPRVPDQTDRLLELIPEGHYLRGMDYKGQNWGFWLQSFGTAWRVELKLQWRGHALDSWVFSLNTALVLGNDPVKFLARMHAQCEMHCWVDGPSRAWLAGIIEQGRALGIYRAEAGWEDVVALLRSRDDEPVVMSYSVCDQFPNSYASTWEAPAEAEDDDAWYDLPKAEQWSHGMAWLREHGPQLSPVHWAKYRFEHGLSAFDLIAPDRDDRLAAALDDPAA
jgi:hypothetical protein